MTKTSQRTCGECTACCQGWLRAQIFETEISPGNPCPHSTGQGCGTYDTRPQVCRNYKCLWLGNHTAFPEWMRPDRSKAIANGITDPLGVRAFKVLPAGTKLPTRTLNFLKQLSTEHRMPLLIYTRIKENGSYSHKISVEAFGPPGMQQVFDYLRHQIKQSEYMDPSTPPEN